MQVLPQTAQALYSSSRCFHVALMQRTIYIAFAAQVLRKSERERERVQPCQNADASERESTANINVLLGGSCAINMVGRNANALASTNAPEDGT